MKTTLILACGALAREILAVIDANKLEHLDLQCLPAQYHLYPEKITDAVCDAVEHYKDQYKKIFIAYADCGTGGALERACAEMGVEMIAGPHCYAFFDGNEAFQTRADEEMTSFYLTDFLVRQFDSFVWQPMGFDKHPELISMMFGNYEKLIYLAQTKDAELNRLAELAAQRLNLEYERRFTGYGDLALALQRQ